MTVRGATPILSAPFVGLQSELLPTLMAEGPITVTFQTGY